VALLAALSLIRGVLPTAAARSEWIVVIKKPFLFIFLGRREQKLKNSYVIHCD
jgi:hypothetical protein